MDSSQPFISDELLSAYIDGEISGAERAQIEAALAADESVAWRLQTLRQTVQLLNELPSVAAPRSFALRADEVSEVIERRQQTARPNLEPNEATGSAGVWQALRALWHSGSPLWRNAAATSLAVFLALIVADQVAPARIGPEQGTFATVSQPSNADASQAAPAGGAAVEEAVVEDTANEEAAVEETVDEGTADEEIVEEDASAQDEALVEQAAVEAETDDFIAEATPEAEMLLAEESAENAEGEVAAADTADTDDASSDDGDSATADFDAAAPSSAAEAAEMALPPGRGVETSRLEEAGGGNIESEEALADGEAEAPGVAADAAVMSQAAPAAARRAPVEAFSATREVAAASSAATSAPASTAAATPAAATLLMTETALMTDTMDRMTDTMDMATDVVTDATSMTDTVEVTQVVAQPGPGDAELAVTEMLTDADSAAPTNTLLMADAPASPLLPSVAVVTNVVTGPASSAVASAVTETGEVDPAAAERDDIGRDAAATMTATPTPATFSERAVDVESYAERNLLTLQTAQLAAGLLALALGLLWLRSREHK